MFQFNRLILFFLMSPLVFNSLLYADIQVVGHRGTRKFAPENTLSAFEKAIDLGADLLEMDVRETKDKVLVILHDSTVDRTTDGTGSISDLTWPEVQKLDAGSKFSPEFRGERIPSLQQVLERIRGRALPDIDYKAGSVEKIRDELRDAGFFSNHQITIHNWSWPLLRHARDLQAEFLIRPENWGGRLFFYFMNAVLNPPAVDVRREFFSEDLMQAIHNAKKKSFVEVLGTNDVLARVQRAVAAGADYIQTDDLDIVLDYLRSQGLHH